ncbi:MAG: mechanosensitive ion channel [Kiloniellales bacterium]|nr:mechanosensitive ion channel [Kiloniellales bacterium]
MPRKQSPFRLGVSLLAVMMLALSAEVAFAQQPGAELRGNPLVPASTSSPRDTLLGFLENTGIVANAWRAAKSNERIHLTGEGHLASRRAMQAMDFSKTPGGNSFSTRSSHVLMLHEILARINLPPDDDIPGVREVADQGIEKWTIPNTRITIALIADGPRAGQFLFSADTVERLKRFYRLTRHLPYRESAKPGVYEEAISSDRTWEAYEARLRSRLQPVDTASPRAVFDGFLDSVNRAYRLIQDAEAALQAQPPRIDKEKAREIESVAAEFLQRATTTLDLSKVPDSLRAGVGLETVLQLKEILDRTVLPPIEAIPNAAVVAAARSGSAGTLQKDTGPLRWRYPGTGIEIVEVTEGERRGQFLVSAASVARMSEYYDQVRDLPYRPDTYGGLELEYHAPELTPGFYNFYISTPGYLIPRAYFLSGLIEDLPGSFKVLYGHQAVWQWIALFMTVLAILAVAFFVFRLCNRWAESSGPPLSNWLKIPAPVIVAMLVSGAIAFVDGDLNISGGVLEAYTIGSKAIVFLVLALAVYNACKAIAETIIDSPRISEESIDASLLRIGARILGFLAAVWIVIKGIQGLGADLLPLLAGLGVGGLAVALAAQKTIANFIGSLIIFANRPVRVGDFCRYGDRIGTVEQIGLISTRIRSLERTVVTVPNAEFSEMKLENFALRDERLLRTTLQLRYETTADQMRYILAKLRELLIGHPSVTPEPARVRFVGYGAYSKDVEIFAYLRCQDQNTFLAMQEDVLLRMEDIVNEAGSGFALPSQTAYLGRDGGLDADHGDAAEAEVAKWREENKLPFPEFDSARRVGLEDSLDYPPKGSPHHEPRMDHANEAPPSPQPLPTKSAS